MLKYTKFLQRAKDVRSIRFARPEDFDYLPGQFMFVTLVRWMLRRERYEMDKDQTFRKHVHVVVEYIKNPKVDK